VIAVSDTSPFNYLILLEEIDLLPRLFKEVWIPAAVATELAHPGSPVEVRSWLEVVPPWFRIAEELDPSAVRSTPPLHRGEREVIALALARNPDFVLLDDRAARNAALDLGLPVMGTLAILKAGARRGELDLPSALARLARTNFRASDDLLRQVLGPTT